MKSMVWKGKSWIYWSTNDLNPLFVNDHNPRCSCNWHIYPPLETQPPRNEKTNKTRRRPTRQNVIRRSFPTEFPEPKVDLLIVRKAQNHFRSPGGMCVLVKGPKIWDVGVDLTQGGWLVKKLIHRRSEGFEKKQKNESQVCLFFLSLKLWHYRYSCDFEDFVGGSEKKKTVSSSTIFVGKYIIKSSPGWKYDRTPPPNITGMIPSDPATWNCKWIGGLGYRGQPCSSLLSASLCLHHFYHPKKHDSWWFWRTTVRTFILKPWKHIMMIFVGYFHTILSWRECTRNFHSILDLSEPSELGIHNMKPAPGFQVHT